jgi:hypothetical protein
MFTALCLAQSKTRSMLLFYAHCCTLSPSSATEFAQSMHVVADQKTDHSKSSSKWAGALEMLNNMLNVRE